MAKDRLQRAEPIRFAFDERKATAAASLLLQLGGGSLPYFTLIKLLYYVDRESLERFGRPITGDRYVSMRHGPVLSRVFDLVKHPAECGPPGEWSEHIQRAGYSIKLVGLPDLGPLSEAEVKLIADVFVRIPHADRWALRDKMHAELGEWEDPGDSAKELRIETMLVFLGKSEDEINEVRQTAKEQVYFDSIFGR